MNSPRLALIGGQSKKLKISTFGLGRGREGVGACIFGIWRVSEGDLGAVFSFLKDGWARGLGGSRFYFYFFLEGGRVWGSMGLNRWRWERVCFSFGVGGF